MKASVTVTFLDGKFRMKVIDEATGKPPNSLREFYSEPDQVERALQDLGLDRDKIAYMMLALMGGSATLNGVELPEDYASIE
jgi:hypothetical protein